MKDFLSDMLARIKNGNVATLPYVQLHPKTTRVCFEVLNILYQEGYIAGYSMNRNKGFIYLKYSNSGMPTLGGIYRVSTPGRRIFLSSKSLWKPKSSRGIFILSTSKGIVTDKEARLSNVGGEVLCCCF